MDFDQLIPLIVIVLGLIFSMFRRKRQTGQDNETANEADVQPGEEFGFPDFLELDDPTEEQMVLEEESIPVMAEQSESNDEPVVEIPPEPKEAEPPPIPPNTRGKSPVGTRQFPTTSLIDVSPETFRQGIILSEILGKPKTLRRRK
ncbi:hypothetical protein JT359_12875 [Candidatus Poribacteria bacterium]|nr:hypothetical protein [Candidatus Poribacteria bacterium]